MSSPDGAHETAPNERKLTIIVVPHGDLETRSFVLSYGRLKLVVIAAVVMLFAVGLVLATWFPIMTQAARVPGLERELKELERERARVAELARTLQQVEEQYERVRQMLGADAPARGETKPVLPPLRGDTTPQSDESSRPLVNLWPLTAPGFITRALADGTSQHPGLDIAVAKNSYIRAAGAGVVRAAGLDEIYGQYVIIDHGESLETVYGHASRLFVTAGDRVRRGETIGLTGSTGRSTAPHLHFEVRLAGRPVDPLDYVRQPQ